MHFPVKLFALHEVIDESFLFSQKWREIIHTQRRLSVRLLQFAYLSECYQVCLFSIQFDFDAVHYKENPFGYNTCYYATQLSKHVCLFNKVNKNDTLQ